jgi:hypothetical protein
MEDLGNTPQEFNGRVENGPLETILIIDELRRRIDRSNAVDEVY